MYEGTDTPESSDVGKGWDDTHGEDVGSGDAGKDAEDDKED